MQVFLLKALGWIVQQIFLGVIIALIVAYILQRHSAWRERSWSWVKQHIFRRNPLETTVPIDAQTASQKRDRGSWLLVIAILLLTIWCEKLDHANHILHVEMVRYVLPRELSKKQINMFGEYLREHWKPQEVTIRYINGDGEAARYAEDFASAFRAGNWVPDIRPFDPIVVRCPKPKTPPDDNPELICWSDIRQMANSLNQVNFHVTGPNPPRSTIDEKLHPQDVSPVLGDALKSASIPNVGVGYGFNSDPLNTVTVYVGIRPRDKWAVIPAKFLDSKQPEDITDNDF